MRIQLKDEQAWLLACVPPTRAPRAVLEPPDATLAVRWIHGCQAELSRVQLHTTVQAT